MMIDAKRCLASKSINNAQLGKLFYTAAVETHASNQIKFSLLSSACLTFMGFLCKPTFVSWIFIENWVLNERSSRSLLVWPAISALLYRNYCVTTITGFLHNIECVRWQKKRPFINRTLDRMWWQKEDRFMNSQRRREVERGQIN